MIVKSFFVLFFNKNIKPVKHNRGYEPLKINKKQEQIICQLRLSDDIFLIKLEINHKTLTCIFDYIIILIHQEVYMLNFNNILYPIDPDSKNISSAVFDSTDVNIIDMVLLPVLVIQE